LLSLSSPLLPRVLVSPLQIAKEKKMLTDELLELAYATTKAFYSLDR